MKNLKKFALFAISSGIAVVSAFEFVGCGSQASSNVDESNSDDIQIVQTVPEDTYNESEQSESEQNKVEEQSEKMVDSNLDESDNLDEAVATVNSYISSMENGNFTYSITSSSGDYALYNFDGDMVEVDDNGVVAYYVLEDGVNYAITYENGAWQKNSTDQLDISTAVSIIVSDLKDINWTEFDANNNILTGTIDGETVTMQISNGEMLLNFSDEEIVITDIGTTVVDLPEIEDTAEGENIYEIDSNGNYIFNISAIYEVLVPWILGDNQFGRDILSERASDDSYYISEVLYIDADVDMIGFGTIVKHCTDKLDDTYYRYSYIGDDDLYTGFANGEYQTQKEFKEFLNSMKKTKYRTKSTQEVEYTTLDDDYESEHKEEFEALTERVLEKAGVTVDKIYYAFKTPVFGVYASSTYGYVASWDQYYLVEIDGQMQLLQMGVASSIYLGEKNAIANIISNTKYWEASVYSTKEIDNGNRSLYSSTSLLKEIGYTK